MDTKTRKQVNFENASKFTHYNPNAFNLDNTVLLCGEDDSRLESTYSFYFVTCPACLLVRKKNQGLI